MAKTTQKDTVISEQTPQKLQELLVAKQADLLGYKKSLASGELKNTGVIKETKQDIARIKTAIKMNQPGKEGDK